MTTPRAPSSASASPTARPTSSPGRGSCRCSSPTGTADVAKGASLAGHFAPIERKDNADAAALQKAADAAGAFTFVRLEDLASDRANPAAVSFADTGGGEAPNLAPDGTPLTKNGRIHTLTLVAADPAPASGFGVLLDGDRGDAILNPDNPETDGRQLLIREGRNGHNRTEFEDTAPILPTTSRRSR